MFKEAFPEKLWFVLTIATISIICFTRDAADYLLIIKLRVQWEKKACKSYTDMGLKYPEYTLTTQQYKDK